MAKDNDTHTHTKYSVSLIMCLFSHLLLKFIDNISQRANKCQTKHLPVTQKI